MIERPTLANPYHGSLKLRAGDGVRERTLFRRLNATAGWYN